MRGGPDVGAEHDGKRRNETDQTRSRERGGHEPSGGAALQESGQTQAGREGREPVAQRSRQQLPQLGAERAQDAALDHVQAPQQQRDTTHQIENNHRSHNGLLARGIVYRVMP
jgi:hypothetical protein